ncbi:MAG: hypothetical protein JWP27_1638 [Flaviaesturariibacter sp.]|nr:hypothetical protein [Flaviaesturariibacter sp.]
MVYKLLTFVLALFLVSSLNAQTFTLSGRLRDAESGSSIQGATVVLRLLRDSTNTQTTYTDTAGRFQFDNLARDSFRILFSSVGFETLTRRVRIDTADVDMGTVNPPRASKQLTGVVVTSTIPPATQKGDTVQFSASQYKVNPDASSEDLVRKIPGITVENGQVKANGENVQRVTIDGRELFGDDATAALRNLPAEVIDKIQVFDRLSDQAQFTGFDDGNTTKGINIVTKANMRNGQFGRVFAGYGTDERYSAGGNATFFKQNRRLSIVGNFNNINQQNFSQQDLLGVTSTAQRGGGGGGPRGGGGNPRGGSGNRPSAGAGGNQGGGNNGGFGNNGNFLVGQQAGINQTNAFGINFSDLYGKKKNLTLTGSYFFNNATNTTNELSNMDYFANNRFGYEATRDTTSSVSHNNNHRVNARLEWRIDSANQLTITPNLSFQDNTSDRQVGRVIVYEQPNTLGLAQYNSVNATNSTRSGNNLNNTILYRHSFPKRGRTFSVNLNTSYNKRLSDSYVDYFQYNQYSAGNQTDSSSQRFTDQTSKGLQVSTNFVYTEPLGKLSQLQVNYNPTVSKSTADQEAYARDPLSDKYNVFLQNFSSAFENRTKAHNAGLSYRWGDRDRQVSFGANYQHTNLESDRTYPTPLQVDKSFDNILPNAMVRYKLSTRSSVRVMYRANVNQPSVTQLQDVVDPVNAPTYTVGNPDLNQQFMHILSGQYTFTNTAKSLLFVGNVFLQSATDFISNATFTSLRGDTVVNGQRLDTGFLLNKPVNLDGYRSLRSFFTFATPIKAIKTNLNLNGGFSYQQLPGFNNYLNSQTDNYTYTLGTVLASNISQYVDFTVSYSANFNQVRNRSDLVKAVSSTNYFQHTASAQLNLLSKNGWFYQTDFNNQYYSGLTTGNTSFNLWNMGVGKKFLKDRKGELRLNVFDVLGQNQSIARNVTETGIEDVTNRVLQRYFMLTFTYNLRNFGAVATRAAGGGQSRTGGAGRQ